MIEKKNLIVWDIIEGNGELDFRCVEEHINCDVNGWNGVTTKMLLA